MMTDKVFYVVVFPEHIQIAVPESIGLYKDLDARIYKVSPSDMSVQRVGDDTLEVEGAFDTITHLISFVREQGSVIRVMGKYIPNDLPNDERWIKRYIEDGDNGNNERKEV